MNPQRILIVDDEENMRQLLVRSLTGEGYECEAAHDAVQASQLIAASPFDLVLADIRMPGRSGIELLGDIRRHYPSVAVIMLTAVIDTEVAIQAMSLGAYNYVTKPFDLREVFLLVERALEKRRLLLADDHYRVMLEQKVDEKTELVRKTFVGAITSLAEALEAKDPYTNGHSHRTSEIAVALARQMGVSETRVNSIRLAGQVHDIGKIGISESILHKPRRLNDVEYAIIKNHALIGEKILRPVVRDDEILAMVKHHHERYDGGGYPEGISGDAIPLGARIMAVADSFDAMTSSRPYRQAMAAEIVRSQFLNYRGSQFDPEVVDAFLEIEQNLTLWPVPENACDLLNGLREPRELSKAALGHALSGDGLDIDELHPLPDVES